MERKIFYEKNYTDIAHYTKQSECRTKVELFKGIAWWRHSFSQVSCRWGSSRLLEVQQGGKMSRKGGHTFSCFKSLESSGFLQEYDSARSSFVSGCWGSEADNYVQWTRDSMQLGESVFVQFWTHLVDSAVRGGKRLCRLSKHTLKYYIWLLQELHRCYKAPTV